MTENDKLLAQIKYIETAWHNYKAGDVGLFKPENKKTLRDSVDFAFRSVRENFKNWVTPKPKDEG